MSQAESRNSCIHKGVGSPCIFYASRGVYWKFCRKSLNKRPGWQQKNKDKIKSRKSAYRKKLRRVKSSLIYSGLLSRCKDNPRYAAVNVEITRDKFIDIWLDSKKCALCDRSFRKCRKDTHRTKQHYEESSIVFLCARCHRRVHALLLPPVC